ncbi:RNA polymerase sigma factor [Paenibacillus validus]|uniref:RNA polymerase sigma factor n=1 Tax=Paenibacillus validus TaxID=44253 RepID=UPI001FD3B333|nr:RNA polymerase sigma factor [Paenibacillus validus]MED4600985.1 RNA polymerase sigma factor [Paenibacillus validus]MED4604968.1 RNA polymerase sigma factor [Paenibacillus validus]
MSWNREEGHGLVTDEQLVRRMADGDQAAFEAFVHRYHGPLLSYLERTLRNTDKAEDLVQETFIRLLRQLRQGSVPERVRSWMYRVAKNLCVDYWRSPSYRSTKELQPDLPDPVDVRPSIVEIYERQETRKELLQSLDQLTDIQKDIVLLRFFQDLKLQEIAEVVDQPLGIVKSQLYYALRKLRKKLVTSPAFITESEGTGNGAT